MAEERKDRERENVVIFPFMAQGHIIPFLALALHIERRKGYSITFLNTPLNIAKLRSSLPLGSSSIRLLEIPFSSSDHGLPPNSENTDVLPYCHVIRLIEASTTLRPSFEKILRDLIGQNHGRKPLCVVADIFFGWTATVAKELGIFHAVFSGCSGFGLACYYSLWLNLPHRKVDSDEFSLPDFEEASTIHVSQLPLNIFEADGEDPWSKFQKGNLSAWVDSNGVLFNTIRDFDHLGLLYFRRKLNRPVWPIGPVLLPSESRASVGKQNGQTSELCREWLNSKPLNSVLFVSFGSMNTISASQMMQLAMALEKSGKTFIWVVRPPIGFDINSEFRAQEWLPEGFEESVSSRGLLVHNWAPQVEILSHEAVSAFLTHCGWNSVLEALSNGVPLLGWPMAAEQFYNSVLLEKGIGVCVEVARGKKCEVRYEDLAGKIELVMSDSAKGKEMRRKACEVKEMIKSAMKDENGLKGSSSKALDDFFSAAMVARQNTLEGCNSNN
ncbi:UDP-glucuronosyl/UDP-glucosyltransferase [Trema orientale]|uniref:Glycosyltransferase n=1 Tax=Trema orientale TaxID=63057 RepID=A0A2P5EUM7_TREOI|nr:UDP-glucuronosyl/UDP-glucosyltransferase [Trema orientale]